MNGTWQEIEAALAASDPLRANEIAADFFGKIFQDKQLAVNYQTQWADFVRRIARGLLAEGYGREANDLLARSARRAERDLLNEPQATDFRYERVKIAIAAQILSPAEGLRELEELFTAGSVEFRERVAAETAMEFEELNKLVEPDNEETVAKAGAILAAFGDFEDTPYSMVEMLNLFRQVAAQQPPLSNHLYAQAAYAQEANAVEILTSEAERLATDVMEQMERAKEDKLHRAFKKEYRALQKGIAHAQAAITEGRLDDLARAIGVFRDARDKIAGFYTRQAERRQVQQGLRKFLLTELPFRMISSWIWTLFGAALAWLLFDMGSIYFVPYDNLFDPLIDSAVWGGSILGYAIGIMPHRVERRALLGVLVWILPLLLGPTISSQLPLTPYSGYQSMAQWAGYLALPPFFVGTAHLAFVLIVTRRGNGYNSNIASPKL